jgi:hypothetical protein
LRAGAHPFTLVLNPGKKLFRRPLGHVSPA